MRGYEYEKGKYVTLMEENFDKVEVSSTWTLTLEAFVDLSNIDPIFLDKPYCLAPEEQSSTLYALLREALKESRKVALAKLAFHDREHLVAIQPRGRGSWIRQALPESASRLHRNKRSLLRQRRNF